MIPAIQITEGNFNTQKKETGMKEAVKFPIISPGCLSPTNFVSAKK